MKYRIWPTKYDIYTKYNVQRKRWWGWQTVGYELYLPRAKAQLAELQAFDGDER